ncbi:UNVERIFIED_CONTAM: hypothetical protein FKN15_073833 [Acipenser sinensis]
MALTLRMQRFEQNSVVVKAQRQKLSERPDREQLRGTADTIQSDPTENNSAEPQTQYRCCTTAACDAVHAVPSALL